jgi:branched-chain amino acid transport system ATP-binding protein
MLQIAELRVNYGRVPALHGISLHVDEGEAVALIGPNGAGKTTTLFAIFGLVAPAAGTILFEGESLVGASPEKILRRGLALVPEGRHIFGTLSVAENLQLGTTARKDRDEAARDLESVLERFPVLKSYYGRTAATLSGGEQQQLAIARALLSRPRLLLLDEPSLGLAPVVIDVVFDALEELRTEGVTILLVEQNAALALDLADHVFLLETGRIVMEGPSEDLRKDDAIRRAYLGY